MNHKNIDIIISSPTKRAMETSEIIKSFLVNTKIYIEKDLQASICGEIEGTPKEKIKPCTPIEWAEKNNTGENRKIFFKRVENAWKNIIDNKSYQTIVIISHRSVFSVIESILNKKDDNFAIKLRRKNENKKHGIWSIFNLH